MFDNVSVWAVLAMSTIASAIVPSLGTAPADTAPQTVVTAPATASPSPSVSASADPVPSQAPVSASADSHIDFYRSPVITVPAPPKPTPTPTPTPTPDPTSTTDPATPSTTPDSAAKQDAASTGTTTDKGSTANGGAATPATASAVTANVTPGSAQAIAADQMKASYGWGADQLACLIPLWERESNWRITATNPSSGAYGIPQSLPGSKMASAGADWQTNPATQIKWGLGYIHDRYGNPCGAWAHSNATGWY